MNVGLDLISEGAASIRLGRCSALIGYTIACYDWLISIEEEFDLIWTTPQWTAIKSSYILCRYYILFVFPLYIWLFLGNHTEDLCQKIVHPFYGLMTLFHLFPQVVMIIRTWAFTGRNNYILFFLILCLSIFITADIWVFGTKFNIHPAVHYFYGDSGCFGTDLEAPVGTSSTRPGLVMLGAFLMDLSMMIIIVVHCFRIRSTQGRLGRLFIFQGFIVFVLMSTINIAIAWNYLSTSRDYNGVFVPISLTLSNVLACRLTLTLRRQATPSESYQLRMQSAVVGRALRRHEAQAQVQAHTHTHTRGNSDAHIVHEIGHSRAWSLSFSIPPSRPGTGTRAAGAADSGAGV